MLKIKIFTTIFIIYEFMVVMVLHRPNYCVGIFEPTFCEYETYKYIFMCIMLPVLFGVISWWWPKTSCNKCNLNDQNTTDNKITRGDIEYFVSTILLIILKRFFKKHKTDESVFLDVLNAMKKSDTKPGRKR